ncbi:MAG TPA: hypothetical protein VGR73_19980 [Bryobacteraceae bacterium]|nr:hypothetical protein [Bryobacteraceae bacterium]
MFRLAVTLVLFAATVFAATQRLYLKDGDYQLVREYQVQQDRVRYYSTERGDWEEIPLELVDLDRTKKEAAEQQAVIVEDAKVQAEEDAAVRAAREEVERVPVEPGIYYIHGAKLEPIEMAEPKIAKDTKRSVLKILSPLPLPGKSTIELDGTVAPNKVDGREPQFYFRLSEEERFGIAKLTPKKDSRLVESLSIVTAQGERIVDEQVQIVPTFKKQEADLLYKIWPEKPLEPGEYALIQYTEGKMNPKIWDFSVK